MMCESCEQYTRRGTQSGRMHYDEIRVFKALANEKRFSIFSSLADGKKSIRELTLKFDSSPSVLFQHLRVLVNSGLVANWKEGKTTYYFIDQVGCESAQEMFRHLIKNAIAPSDSIATPPA